MNPKFPLYLKSSIDRVVTAFAQPLNLPVVDLDASALLAELLESDAPAIVWAMGTLSEAPKDPLWFVDFDIGAKTSHDPAQYQSMDILGSIAGLFTIGTSITVEDYTGDTNDGEVYGDIYITNISASPSQPDRLSGIRLLNVQARAISHG